MRNEPGRNEIPKTDGKFAPNLEGPVKAMKVQ
jgi:hypothetical protein